MRYLHTMIRATDLEETLDFFVDKLGLIEAYRYDNDAGRFTLVFLSCLLYTSPSPRDRTRSRMPSSA